MSLLYVLYAYSGALILGDVALIYCILTEKIDINGRMRLFSLILCFLCIPWQVCVILKHAMTDWFAIFAAIDFLFIGATIYLDLVFMFEILAIFKVMNENITIRRIRMGQAFGFLCLIVYFVPVMNYSYLVRPETAPPSFRLVFLVNLAFKCRSWLIALV